MQSVLQFRRGWAQVPGLAGLLLALVVLGATAGCTADEGPGPAGSPVEGWRPPERIVDADRVTVQNAAPRERLVVYADPTTDVQLLFMQGRTAVPVGGGRVAWPDADGARVVIFDDRGTVAAVLQGVPVDGPPLVRPLFVAAPGAEVWVVEGDGSSLVFEDGAPAGWLTASLPAPPATGGGDFIAATRTFLEFELAVVGPQDPLIWLLDRDGQVERTVGAVEVPHNGLLGQLVNSGWVAADASGGVYFAHGLRPEIRYYDRNGRESWRSVRPFAGEARAPRFKARDGTLDVEFVPIHFGITVGPDGLVYVLGAADTTGTPEHLYTFDRDGVLVRAGPVPRDQALFADDAGRVYTLPPGEALARTGEPERATFPPFVLPGLMSGETIELDDYRGRIVVLNFWASWCRPCRAEMPALDAYARQLDSAEVAIIGANDDVDPDAARTFVSELGIAYPSVEGRGRLRERYAYRGLPYTVILDREQRVIKAIYGFGTTIAPIREVVERELTTQRR